MQHLHFVQSIEPLQGGGLGQGALGMHLAMMPLGSSKLVATCASDFKEEHPNTTLCVRSWPPALYYSSKLHEIARSSVKKADWVHGHGLYVGTNAVLGTEAIRQGKPLCYHTQGFFDPWILNRSKWKKKIARALFEDRNFKSLRLWRALTRKEYKQIRALGMKQPIEVLPNGIRLEEIDQPTTPKDGELFQKRLRPKRVLFLGRIHPKKGLDILIPVWAALAAKFPDWELMIVGPDEGGYLATVQQMIHDAGVGDSIQIIGSVSGATKVAAFRSSDIFVLPSYSEGFPVAVVEAAAHGLPCVITTECNFPELAEEQGAFECLPTVDSFRDGLQSALSLDDVELKQRGALGRQLIEKRYTWPSIAKDMYSVCASML